MEAFIFVLVLNINPLFDDFKYIGHFKSCDIAMQWVKENHPKVPKEARCLFEEYIYLPEGYRKRVVDIHDACKLRRDCNDS